MPIEKAKSQKLKAKKSGIKVYKFLSGFTFIELLIVISLMAIVAAGVSAAYLSFENRQRVTEAANIVRSSIRLAQNDATSGKVSGCVPLRNLGAWSVSATVGDSKITVAGYCIPALRFSSTDYKLSSGVTISSLVYGSTPIAGTIAYIVFRPLTQGATFHSAAPFLDSITGDLINLFGTQPQDPFTINLSSSAGTSSVIIYSSGEVK